MIRRACRVLRDKKIGDRRQETGGHGKAEGIDGGLGITNGSRPDLSARPGGLGRDDKGWWGKAAPLQIEMRDQIATACVADLAMTPKSHPQSLRL